MTGTNHVLAGALIGLTVHNPEAAVVLAVTSHFVLDSLPHFGYPNHNNKKFLRLLTIDGLAIAAIVVLLAVIQPAYWGQAIACGLLAASPDFMWLPGFLREIATGKKHPSNNAILRFHKKIQWGERPGNWPYEVVLFSLVALTLVKLA